MIVNRKDVENAMKESFSPKEINKDSNRTRTSRKLEDSRLRKNAEGYSDPTAYEAIKKVDDEYERFQKVLGCILRVCDISDFKVDGRITLVDKRTGKVWG